MLSSNYTSTAAGGDDQLGQTAHITIFSLGSLVLVFLIIAACCLFRTQNGLFFPTAAEQPTDGKRGLDESVIGSYPKFLFSQVKLRCWNSKEASASSCCSICLADYGDDDGVLLLPDCGHFFHVTCVNEWLRTHSTCPVCRNLLFSVSDSVPQDLC